MTAFKSDGAMHLRGKAAKKWVEKIKKEKAEQDKARKVSLSPEHGIISVLNRLYDFRGGLAVEKFLRNNIQENANQASVLLVVPDVIRGHFGSDARVALEVVTDPEAPADQQLFVIIRTKLPRKITRELLSIVERGWWRSVPLAIRKKMELDVE